MVAPLVALGKAYAVNKAKNFATSKLEQALGLPKDTISAVTNPTGFAKNIAKDMATDYVKNSLIGREEIPVEDRSFVSTSGGSGGGSTGGIKDIVDEAPPEVAGYKRGGKVKSKANTTSRRGDGIAQRGKTKGRYL